MLLSCFACCSFCPCASAPPSLAPNPVPDSHHLLRRSSPRISQSVRSHRHIVPLRQVIPRSQNRLRYPLICRQRAILAWIILLLAFSPGKDVQGVAAVTLVRKFAEDGAGKGSTGGDDRGTYWQRKNAIGKQGCFIDLTLVLERIGNWGHPKSCLLYLVRHCAGGCAGGAIVPHDSEELEHLGINSAIRVIVDDVQQQLRLTVVDTRYVPFHGVQDGRRDIVKDAKRKMDLAITWQNALDPSWHHVSASIPLVFNCCPFPYPRHSQGNGCTEYCSSKSKFFGIACRAS